MKEKLKVIAYYLPQYHTIPENDEWWGEGFTEWVNVKKAKPLFKGHKQPNVPVPELGYYNLLDNDVRRKQTALAKEAGIDGFCYWHYWFGNGKMLLEKPFQMMLADKKNNHGFCLGWANESWKAKQWSKDGRGDKLLIEQLYPGDKDYEEHFTYCLPAFKDNRYIKYNGRPIFLLYKPMLVPDLSHFIYVWNKLAEQNGFPSMCFVCCYDNSKDIDYLKTSGIDFIVTSRINIGQYPKYKRFIFILKNFLFRRPYRVIDYKNSIKWAYTKEDKEKGLIPTVFPNWDHSPRSGRKCTALHNAIPTLFYKQIMEVLKTADNSSPFLFVKSWNEWGEGNYMEPDTVYKKGYIEAMHNALKDYYSK